MNIGGFRDSLDKSLGIIVKLLLIGAILIALCYLGISIYANVVMNKPPVEPTAPDISKAHYKIIIRNTGEIFYSDDYTLSLSPYDPTRGELTLHNYWEIKDGEYKLFKHDLVLDEYYWGKIIIERRENPQ